MTTILPFYNGDGSKMIGMFGMGNPKAEWGSPGHSPADSTEPDWKALEP